MAPPTDHKDDLSQHSGELLPPQDSVHNLLDRTWTVPWHAHIAPLVLGGITAIIWLKTSHNGDMPNWALSWHALREGRAATIATHIFAHGGLLHLFMNVGAMLLLSGPLVSRLGTPPLSWARFLYLYFGSGVLGGLLFLAMHTSRDGSMLGASGALFGVLGALARVHPATGEVVAVRSVRTWSLAKLFLQNHLVLFALVFLMALVTGVAQGLAWQAHLGGMLFGFFAAPLYLPKSQTDPNSGGTGRRRASTVGPPADQDTEGP
jgi:membrane associated rhomboid family serine protease